MSVGYLEFYLRELSFVLKSKSEWDGNDIDLKREICEIARSLSISACAMYLLKTCLLKRTFTNGPVAM
jgi:hypothetical protein